MSRENQMNSQEICEVSAEVAESSGLWRKNLWKRNVISVEWESEGVIDGESVRVVRMKRVSWGDHKAVMSQEETGKVVAHEMSQEVDSRDEAMHIEKSDQ